MCENKGPTVREVVTAEGNIALRRRAEKAEALIARVAAWTHAYGSELVPAGVDTYGEGVRDCKARVARIIGEMPPPSVSGEAPTCNAPFEVAATNWSELRPSEAEEWTTNDDLNEHVVERAERVAVVIGTVPDVPSVTTEDPRTNEAKSSCFCDEYGTCWNCHVACGYGQRSDNPRPWTDKDHQRAKALLWKVMGCAPTSHVRDVLHFIDDIRGEQRSETAWSDARFNLDTCLEALTEIANLEPSQLEGHAVRIARKALRVVETTPTGSGE